MSFRDWLPSPPVGVGLGVVLLLIVAAASTQHRNQTACGNPGTEKYLSGAACEVPGTRVAPIIGVETAERNTRPKRDEWRQESDLEAQWHMVWWAKVSAFIAGLGLAITGVGIVLVKQTLTANREAVAEARKATQSARETGEAQVRAYVTFAEIEVVVDRIPIVRLSVRNSGNSPAIEVQVSASVRMEINRMPVFDGIDLARVTILCGSLRQSDSNLHEIHIGTTWLSLEQTQALSTAHALVVIARLRATYLDVFGVRRRDVFDYMGVMTKPELGRSIRMSPTFEFHREALEGIER